MLQLHRTKDAALVKQIWTHPALWPWLTDDRAGTPEAWVPQTDNPQIHYLVVHDDGCVLGLYITHPINVALWEVHHAILPSAFKRTNEIGEAFERWLWENTPAQTAVGFTPAFNRPALKYAKRHGMEPTGILRNSYLKSGRLHDIHIFQKNRPAA